MRHFQKIAYELAEIFVPDGVTHVQASAFSYCTNLKAVYIPKSVAYIEDDVLSGNAVTAFYAGTTEGWAMIENSPYWIT